MHLRQEFSLKTAGRVVARRAWVVMLVGLALAAVAYRLAEQQESTYKASGRLHVVETVVSYDNSGKPIPATIVPRTVSEVSVEAFLVPDVARIAVKREGLERATPTGLLPRLVVTPLTTTDVSVQLSGPSQANVVRLLRSYLDSFVEWKRAQERTALENARRTLARTLELTPAGSTDFATSSARADVVEHISSLRLAGRLLDEQITASGPIDVSAARPLSPPVAGLGGLFAGLAGGALLVLLLARLDPWIRRASDIALPASRIADVDSSGDPDAFQRLRATLELARTGDRLVVAVTANRPEEGKAPAALGLAQAFADVGTQTVLVAGDLHSSAEIADGIASSAESGAAGLPVIPVDDGLVWIPGGEAAGAGPVNFSSEAVQRLLGAASQHGRVTVVEAPPVGDDADALLFAAHADAVILVVRRSKSTWSGSSAALEALETASEGRVVVCFDRASRRGPAARSGRGPGPRTQVPSPADDRAEVNGRPVTDETDAGATSDVGARS